MGLLPVQVPAWQVSVCVQASPSSQGVPVSGVQVPSLVAPLAAEQAWHVPVHAALQHTPSTQKLLAQSRAFVHTEPVAPEPP